MKTGSARGLGAVALTALMLAQPAMAEDAKPAAPSAGTGWSAEIAPSANRGIALDESQVTVVKTVSDYFNHVLLLPGQKIIFLCSDRPIDTDIPARLHQKGIQTAYISGYFYAVINGFFQNFTIHGGADK